MGCDRTNKYEITGSLQSKADYVSMNALIVCHAGTGLGLGHLARALVVAKALRQNLAMNVQLLILGNFVQRTDLQEFDHQFLAINDNLSDAILRQTRQIQANSVIFDLHPRLVPPDFSPMLKALRSDGCKLIGVDGLVGHRENLDLIFIPSFHFSPPINMTGGAPILFGWDCYLLNVMLPVRDWAVGRKVLALAGGSDASGLGKTLPALLNQALPADAELHWVTGPYARQPIWPQNPRISMLNHQSPASLDNLFVASNYAVTAYGVSFFELLHYGVPTVVFSPYGNRDDAELAHIAELGIAIVARDELAAVDKLIDLMAQQQLATTLSQRARQRLSISGKETFSRAIADLFD